MMKGMWHIAVIILLLSLPTFSFFMPGFELSDLAFLGGKSSSDETLRNPSSATLPGDEFDGTGMGNRAGFTPSVRGVSNLNRAGLNGKGGRSSGRNAQTAGLGGAERRGIISREGLNGTGRDDGQSGLRGDGERISADLLEAVLKDLESLDEAVKTLSSGYGSQGYSGSGSSRYINPFLRSLANDNGDGDSSGDSGGDGGNGDSGGGDSGSGDSGGDSGGGDSGGGSSGDDNQDVDPQERLYNALLIGNFQEDQEYRTLKASRGESDLKYYLDDGAAVDLFYSGAGSTPGVIVEFSQGEIVLTSDYNSDGRDDLLVVHREEFGDVVTCWARVLDNQTQEAFSGSFPYLTVSGLDFFDWNSDGVKELVVAFENTSNLYIYNVVNKTLRYSREFTLPFEPSSVVSTTSVSPFKTNYLHVGNDSLDQSVLFNSRYPGVYSFMTPVTLRSSRTIALDSADEETEPLEFLAVEYNDRLLVLNKLGNYYVTACSLGLKNSSPTASILKPDEADYLKILLGY